MVKLYPVRSAIVIATGFGVCDSALGQAKGLLGYLTGRQVADYAEYTLLLEAGQALLMEQHPAFFDEEFTASVDALYAAVKKLPSHKGCQRLVARWLGVCKRELGGLIAIEQPSRASRLALGLIQEDQNWHIVPPIVRTYLPPVPGGSYHGNFGGYKRPLNSCGHPYGFSQ